MALKLYTEEVKKVLKEVDREMSYEVLEEAVDLIQEDTPYLTGKLKKGYKANKGRGKGKATMTSDEEYWIQVEKGNSRQAAQPHITPVLGNVQKMKQIIKKVVDRIVARN